MLTTPPTLGPLIIISGPSGVGKDTLITAALPHLTNTTFIPTATTRPPRPGEHHGIDYHFLTHDHLTDLIASGDTLEHMHLNGHTYATLAQPITERRNAHLTTILRVTPPGMHAIRAHHPDAHTIFIAPPTLTDLHTRLTHRNTDTPDTITTRLAHATTELAAAADYDTIIINNDLTTATTTLITTITTHQHHRPTPVKNTTR